MRRKLLKTTNYTEKKRSSHQRKGKIRCLSGFFKELPAFCVEKGLKFGSKLTKNSKNSDF